LGNEIHWLRASSILFFNLVLWHQVFFCSYYILELCEKNAVTLMSWPLKSRSYEGKHHRYGPESVARDGANVIETVDIRDFSVNRHRTVDSPPAGGGPGMVLKPDIAAKAIDSVVTSDLGSGDDRPLIYLTPRSYCVLWTV